MLSKREALKDILELYYEFEDCTISLEQLLDVISEDKYNLAKGLGYSSGGCTKFLDRNFKDRVNRQAKLCTNLLYIMDQRYCSACSSVKDKEEFDKNNSRWLKTNSWCKSCALKNQRKQPNKWKEYASNRRNIISKHTPSWTNRDKIKEFYNNCPAGYHVDHKIPLNGKLVSGLHIVENLQYLTEHENLRKGNSFIPI